MAFRLLAYALLPSALLLQACGSEESGAPGAMDSGGGQVSKRQVSFDSETPLTLEPLEAREVVVAVTPATRGDVRLALLSNEGELPNDALLEQDVVTTDDAGRASFELVAPSGPTSFVLRASIEDGETAWLEVLVNAAGRLTLRVQPVYPGRRSIQTWSATVLPGLTCEGLASATPESELTGVANYPSPIAVPRVPVGPAAIIVNAGHYVEGCATLNELMEGKSNRVIVPLNDRPIQLSATELALGFGFETVAPEWSASLASVIEQARGAIVGAAVDDIEAVLDAMQAELHGPRAVTFAERRATNDWDAHLLSRLGEERRDVLRRRAGEWMVAGQAELREPGAISAQIRSDPEAGTELVGAEGARFTLTDVAGHEPLEAGFVDSIAASWSANSHDTLLIAGSVPWSPSKLLTALALAPAQEAFPNAKSTAEALSNELSCTALASWLVVSSPEGLYDAGPGYGACSASCALKLCRTAVAAMWQRAIDVSGNTAQSFDFSATGDASVGDDAEITALSGTWVGRASSATDSATTGGPFTGEKP